ncbi:alpha/beta fold hydrolase [Shewanella sp. JBTF-M18]|uniref:Alpha/beta fold hydrolase n=1 Tax=Shewanella insulae TaxID=2681496 RepID=A0A6L7HSP7_9GAMM|nr:alpha/beta fold hydrolase [Shewanella insulae]
MTSLNYTQSGEGSPVILIHGLFGNLDNLKSLGNSLDKHQVIRLDVPNHGLSPHWPNMDYPMLAEAVIGLMDELELESAHLVGHSMGGKIAMATALLYGDRVKSLVAADIAPVAYQPRHQKVFAGLSNLDLSALANRADAQKQLLSAGIDEGTALFLLKNLTKDEQGFAWKMNLTGLKSSYDHLIGWPLADKQYKGPSLCIRGADSDYVTAAHRQGFLSQFPKIQAKSLAGTGHWLHAQKPAIFNRIVAEFIAQND